MRSAINHHSVPLPTCRHRAPLLLPNQLSVFQPPLNFAPSAPKLQPNPPCFRLFPPQYLFPKSPPKTPNSIERIVCLPWGGSLQTTVSDAPPKEWPAYTLTAGRIRYSTNVSRKLLQQKGLVEAIPKYKLRLHWRCYDTLALLSASSRNTALGQSL